MLKDMDELKEDRRNSLADFNSNSGDSPPPMNVPFDECELPVKSKLFIIGNGFDTAHGLKTSYNDFRSYVENGMNNYAPSWECLKALGLKWWIAAEWKWHTPPRLPRERAVTKADPYIVENTRFFFRMLDKAASKHGKIWEKVYWNNFEELLGEIDYEKILKNSHIKIESGLFDITSSMQSALRKWFVDWMRNIDISSATPFSSLTDLINTENDLVLTFNYTETMESVYRVKEENVRHIHGARDTDPDCRKGSSVNPVAGKDNELITFGHKKKEITDEEQNREVIDDGRTERKGVASLLEQTFEKDTDYIVRHNQKNLEFYDRVEHADIEHIYSYGFSFAEVDDPQIRELIKRLNRDSHATRNMVWHLAAYDERRGNNCEYRRKIRSLGFEGKFGEPLDLSNSNETASEEEYQMLRTEILQYMEEYQSVRNMMYLVTVAILAINGSQIQNQYLFLLPLAVILPSYLVYLDYWNAVIRAATYLQVFYEKKTDALFHWETRSAELAAETKSKKQPGGGSRQRICYYACAAMCFACYIGYAVGAWFECLENEAYEGNVLSLAAAVVIGLLAFVLSVWVFVKFKNPDKDRKKYLTAWEKVKD